MTDKSRFHQNSATPYKQRIAPEDAQRIEHAVERFRQELCRLYHDTDCKAVGARVVKQRGRVGNVRILPEYEYDAPELKVAEGTLPRAA